MNEKLNVKTINNFVHANLPMTIPKGIFLTKFTSKAYTLLKSI